MSFEQDDSWFSPAFLAKLRGEASPVESTFTLDENHNPEGATDLGSEEERLPSPLMHADDPEKSTRPNDHGPVPALSQHAPEERRASPTSTPVTESDSLPLPSPYLLDAGLAKAIREAPPQVAAFLLHAPKDQPAWRCVETESERARRELLEDQGGWTG